VFIIENKGKNGIISQPMCGCQFIHTVLADGARESRPTNTLRDADEVQTSTAIQAGL